jgi:hypothetical protein
MKQANSRRGRAIVLQIWIPQRASVTAMKALQERFPYRGGEWFDQSVTGQKAPSGFHLAFIRLAEDLSAEQIAYLEMGKQGGLIAKYDVYE